MHAGDLPLAGHRVIDFANGLAGPLAGMVLADLGADVIKVEPQGRGDLTRDLVPAMFVAVNRSKRSIAIDLKSPRGVEIARRLLDSADVLVESFRPGIMDRLGLGAAELCAANQRLIYASVSGFGSSSEARSRRAVDAVAQAHTGMISTNEGVEAPFTVVDTTCGLVLAQAVLAALVRRHRTGRGGVVEAPLVATALSLQAVQLADRALTGTTLTPSERARRAPTAGVFEASDGLVYVAAHYEDHWRALAEELGVAELVDDARFATRDERVANSAELRRLLAARFVLHDRSHWFDRLDGRGVMIAPVRSHAEVLTDAELWDHGWLHNVDATPLVALPFAIDGAPLGIRAGAPALGADSTELLAEIGYGAEDVVDLVGAGVVQDGSGGTNSQ